MMLSSNTGSLRAFHHTFLWCLTLQSKPTDSQSLINTIQYLIINFRYFENNYDPDAQLRILYTGYLQIKKVKIAVGRIDLVFKILEMMVERGEYLDAMKLALSEYKVLTAEKPTTIKRKTFACDVVLLALLQNDHVFAEKKLSDFGMEYLIPPEIHHLLFLGFKDFIAKESTIFWT